MLREDASAQTNKATDKMSVCTAHFMALGSKYHMHPTLGSSSGRPDKYEGQMAILHKLLS